MCSTFCSWVFKIYIVYLVFILVGGSAAQFRFKDEEEWAEESQSAVAPVLALNLESLSESLSCIPLHERLEINESLFTVSIIYKGTRQYLLIGLNCPCK